MPVEIERKFLVIGSPPHVDGVKMVQGYLCKDTDRTVRIRIERQGGKVEQERAVLTVKGRSEGIVRPEYEYDIPVADARELMGLCVGSIVEKTRYCHYIGAHVWEVDVFEGGNQGLIVAEIELSDPSEAFEKPNWIGCEVSSDPRYANSSLSRKPFTEW
jgi:CYTH domain-containing protein